MPQSDFRDVRHKIHSGYYDVTEMSYPKCPNKPRLALKHTSEDAVEYAMFLKEYERLQKLYCEELKKYCKLIGDKHELFKKEALEECGLTDHPRADKAYSYAWEEGHHAGNSEVMSHLENIADVLIG